MYPLNEIKFFARRELRNNHRKRVVGGPRPDTVEHGCYSCFHTAIDCFSFFSLIYGKTVLLRNTIKELSAHRGKNAQQAIQVSQLILVPQKFTKTKKCEKQIGAKKVINREFN